MAEAQAARAERMAQESVALLASIHGEAGEAAQNISLVEGELAVARQAQDTAEAKLPDLVDKAVNADQR
jgi:uncharacterized protein YigA (DUF484 family)